MKDAKAIFRFLLDAAARGERTALVTITEVVGSSSRSAGTHMAVSESGASVGSFSGGCVEAAVIGEAQRVIVSGRAESIRLGADSPLIDIRLPCGGGIDLLFVPEPNEAVIRAAYEGLERREPVALAMTRDGTLSLAADDGDSFVAVHEPDLRLALFGHGAEIQALAALARAYGLAVAVFSPDEAIVAKASAAGIDATWLKTPAALPVFTADARTAIVFLFHDHDWETALLAQALGQEACYIGAMGSRRTQAERIAALIEHGVPPDRASRVIGPIGLIPATRDPDTLALSVLAQIVAQADGAATEQARK